MTHTEAMLASHPGQPVLDSALVREAIDACYACAQACTSCADACLSEDEVAHLVLCVRLNLDCADLCETTARHLSRQGAQDAGATGSLLAACVQACQRCGDECEAHAADGMEHCRICAEACRACQEACNRLLATLGP